MNRIPLHGAWLALLFAVNANAQLLGTAFTYQGSLSVGGQPANGAYDLRFDAFPAATTGAPLNVAPLVLDNVVITGGLFAVQVDFGAAVFIGAPVFLEIGVRDGVAGDATNPLGFQNLTPRQSVRPAPYALHAERVALDSVGADQIGDGTIGAADIDAASVQRRVSGSCPVGQTIRAIAADGTVTCAQASQYTAGNGISSAVLSSGTIAIDPIVVPSKDVADGNQIFGADLVALDYATGRVGLGNAAPQQRLDVTGNARVSGSVFATTYLLPTTAIGYYATAASNFVQNRANTDDDTYDFNSDVYATITGTTPFDVRVSSPVHLPALASPQSVTCEVYDNDATQNLTLSANVRRQSPGVVGTNGDAVAAITTTGASTAIQTATANINANPEDDATISMIVTFSITGPSSSLRFYGCRIAYGYTRLGH